MIKLALLICLMTALTEGVAEDKKKLHSAVLSCKSMRYVAHAFPPDGGSVVFEFHDKNDHRPTFYIMARHNVNIENMDGPPEPNRFFFLNPEDP